MCLARPEGFEPPTFWSVAIEMRNKKPNKIKVFSIRRGDFQPRVSFIMCDCSP